MVGTAKGFSSSFGLRHHRRGVVSANIEESAQNAVTPSYEEDRFTGELASHVLTRLANLIGAPYHLPRARENSAAF
jgi:hypothetical protein